MKEIIVIGGPNGAGKTSTAQILLPSKLKMREFVNADEIARGLSPFNSEGAAIAAGRLMLRRMQELTKRGQSFAFEATCSGRSHINFLKGCKDEGWRVSLLFLWLPTPQSALDRVAKRVREGGHSIPDDVVVRRYWSGLVKVNMHKYYLPLADVAKIYDNSNQGPMLVAQLNPKGSLVIRNQAKWAKILGSQQ